MENALAPDSNPDTAECALRRAVDAVARGREGSRPSGSDRVPRRRVLARSIVLVRPNYEIRELHNSRRDLKSDLGPITRSKRPVGVQRGCSSWLRCVRELGVESEARSAVAAITASEWLVVEPSGARRSASYRASAAMQQPCPLAMPKE